MKRIASLIVPTVLIGIVLMLTSCGGGGGGSANDTADNSHMFGTFMGTFLSHPEGSQDLRSDPHFSFHVGNDMSRITEVLYIYMPIDANEFTYSQEYERNGTVTTFSYNANSTDNSITWERKYKQNGVVDTMIEEGNITFNSDFVTGSIRGSVFTIADDVKIIFQMDDMIKQ